LHHWTPRKHKQGLIQQADPHVPVIKILLLLGSLILMALFGAVAITTWSADTAWQPPDNVQLYGVTLTFLALLLIQTCLFFLGIKE
jgi:hypothetical protein